MHKLGVTIVSLVSASMLILAGCGQNTSTSSNSGGNNGGATNSSTTNSTTNAAANSASNSVATTSSNSTNNASSQGGSGQQLTQVTFATLPIADSAVVVLAQKDGIFKKNGLDVKLDVVQTGPATTSAVVSGAAQFSQSNYATLFSAKSKGVPIEIFAEAANAQPGFSYVVTSPNSSIKSPKDLAGKRIATAVIGGIGPVAIDYWLKQHGVDYKSIKWVQMPFQDMGAALQRKQVDAAWVVEPFSTKLTQSSNDKVVFDVFSGPTAGWPVAAYMTSQSYLKSHPDVVAAFRKSVEEAAQIAKQDPTAIPDILPTYTALSKSLAGQIHLESYPTSMNVADIQKIATAMKDTGFLSSSFDASTAVAPGQ